MATTRTNDHLLNNGEPLCKRSRTDDNDVSIDLNLKRLMSYNNEFNEQSNASNSLPTKFASKEDGDSGFQEFTSNDSPASKSSFNDNCEDETNNNVDNKIGNGCDQFKQQPTTDNQFASINQLKTSNNNELSNDSLDNQLSQTNKYQNLQDDLLNDLDNDDDNESIISDISCLSSSLSAELGDLEDVEKWQSSFSPFLWVHKQMFSGTNPREVIDDLLPNNLIPDTVDNLTLWKVILNLLSEPPKRKKLDNVNSLDDVVNLIRTSKKIIVLSGAGISVSSGIPDFRSRDGIYARLSVDFPDLPDPQAMFDIHYFRRDQRPFYKFAKEIYPGQFKPSIGHKFVKLIEQNGKLLRNYTQNIDTLEQAVNIERLITCHGSFSTASCTNCDYKVDGSFIREDVFAQRIPKCPRCPEQGNELSVLKPDIVFFGEGLPKTFHDAMEADKDDCDLLIVIGSSLKVKPVADIPSSIPANIPQILINREHLPHMTFDVELLGDCDVIVQELCHRLGDGWNEICVANKLNEMNFESLNKKAEATSASMSTDDQSISKSSVEQENILNSNADSNASNSSGSNYSIEKLKDFVNILPEDAFVHCPPARYLFRGAEVYSRSDDISDESSDDEPVLIRNDSNSNLSTSQNADRQQYSEMVNDFNQATDKDLNSLPPIDSNN